MCYPLKIKTIIIIIIIIIISDTCNSKTLFAMSHISNLSIM